MTFKHVSTSTHFTSDGLNNDYGSPRLQHLSSSPIDQSGDSSAFDGDRTSDRTSEQILRRVLLTLLPSRSTYLREVLGGGRSRSGVDENKSDKRNGNYIRFGKKHSPLKRTEPKARSYMASFGTWAKKPDGGQFMRFGRSVGSRNTTGGVSTKKNELQGTKNASKISAKSSDWKRFMRFGRRPAAMEKRFMRFGRAYGKDDSAVEDRDQSREADLPFDMLFSRFSRNFMRFGRSRASPTTDSNDVAGKRYMRFGKRQDPFSVHGARQQKRFMRFGRDLRKKRFMRFGKAQSDGVPKQINVISNEIEDAAAQKQAGQIQSEKRFMRFGKRHNEGANRENSLYAAQKRFMRFGKRTLIIDGSSPKRFMRFGKRTPTTAAKKRFLRFGKKSSQGTAK